jgi:hypothetical protein
MKGDDNFNTTRKQQRAVKSGTAGLYWLNPLKTEGILRKFQKVIEKWKDIKNNGTT